MRPAAPNRSRRAAICAAIRLGARLVLAALFLWPPPAGRTQPAEAPEYPEYDIKADLLRKLACFTDWPSNAFASTNAPLVVGVVGRDPFGPALDETFSGKTVNGRSIVVKRLNAGQDLKQCHLLFVPASEKRRERDLLDKLKGAPVLTVGESDDFLDHGGAVQLLIRDKSVRFSVNLHPAKATGPRISAKVIQLAVSVRGRYE